MYHRFCLVWSYFGLPLFYLPMGPSDQYLFPKGLKHQQTKHIETGKHSKNEKDGRCDQFGCTKMPIFKNNHFGHWSKSANKFNHIQTATVEVQSGQVHIDVSNFLKLKKNVGYLLNTAEHYWKSPIHRIRCLTATGIALSDQPPRWLAEKLHTKTWMYKHFSHYRRLELPRHVHLPQHHIIYIYIKIR